jgi:hypothetical protein
MSAHTARFRWKGGRRMFNQSSELYRHFLDGAGIGGVERL